ncbi:coiled-coil domain-containing protein 65, partial [Silurus asotus]
DKQQKEVRNTRVNLKKLNQLWHASLRQTAAAALHEDFAVLRQAFERVVDCKDDAIQLLVHELSEAEHQSALAKGTHLQRVDHLLNVQKSRLASLESHWNTSLEELTNECCTEREHFLKRHQRDIEYLEAANSALEQHYAGIESEAQQNYQNERDDIKNRNTEEKHALSVHLEGTVEELWQQLQQEQEKYTEATNNLQADFNALSAKDQQNAQQANLLIMRIQKLQETITALHSHLSSSQVDNEASACDLREECEQVSEKIQQLRAKLSTAQAAEKTRLANHMMHSYKALKKLQDINEEGETLLSLVNVCRKLETEQEQVVPFYTSSLTDEELSQEKENAMKSISEELAQTMMDYTDLLRFWQRFNKVRLERLCLEREKKFLELENQQLRILVKQHLDGFSVNEEILQQQNSLLMVSGALQQTSPPSETRTKTHRTVIEAAHVVQHIL